MASWYECKVGYQKQLDNGSTLKIKETYLVDAVNFTEAEARIYKELGEILGEFTLDGVSRARITELVHNEDAFKWFKCKVAVVSVDERSGKERKVVATILASANNVAEAYAAVDEFYGTSVDDYEITDVNSTQIVEIFPFHFEEKTEEEKSTSVEEVIETVSNELQEIEVEELVSEVELSNNDEIELLEKELLEVESQLAEHDELINTTLEESNEEIEEITEEHDESNGAY